MKELFYYNKPGQDHSSEKVLVVRPGSREISFAVTNKEGSDLYYLAYCVVDDHEEISITAFEQKYPALHHSYNEVKIVFNYPQSILLSFTVKTEDTLQLLENCHGNMDQVIALSEDIPEWQLKNIYAVPKEIYDWVTDKFPSAKYKHEFSAGIKSINTADSDGLLLVDFRKYDFTVIATKQSGTMLAQSFEYSTPEDVLYYLLKTCQQFALSQTKVRLQLSGLIDKQSSLYKELYQYFINIEFREAGWGITGNDYPAHFFTSLNDLARCES